MRIGGERDRGPLDRERSDLPLWRQAAAGMGVVALGAVIAIIVGVLMAAVVAWLF